MSIATMKKAIGLGLGVIHSMDYLKLLKSGEASREIDGITEIRNCRYVISDEAFTMKFLS